MTSEVANMQNLKATIRASETLVATIDSKKDYKLGVDSAGMDLIWLQTQ